jgi:hypothetical protein
MNGLNDFFLIAEIIILAVLYVWISYTWLIIYQSYADSQNKPEVLSSEDDINIVEKK